LITGVSGFIELLIGTEDEWIPMFHHFQTKSDAVDPRNILLQKTLPKILLVSPEEVVLYRSSEFTVDSSRVLNCEEHGVTVGA